MNVIPKTRAGFTIVELLIVIVIIGILAAITVVAYNGITTRSRNAQVTAGANAYYKALVQYEAVNGSYPTSAGRLGANYPSNQCWRTNGSADRSVNTTLDAQLGEFIPNKPTLATKLMDLGLISPGYYMRAGLFYNTYSSSTSIEMRYYLEGLNQNCIGGFTFANEGSLTRCIKILSN